MALSGVQSSRHEASDIKVRMRNSLHLTGGCILAAKVSVSLALDESVHPRKLRLVLAELPVEISVCFAINAVLRRSVGFALVGIVEPSIWSVSHFHCSNAKQTYL